MDDGTVRVGILVGLPALLRSLGADPAAIVAEAGFDPGALDEAEHMVSYAARGRLLGQCVARTGCRHLGLLLGKRGRLSSLGLAGLLAQCAPDVDTALKDFARYTFLSVSGGVTDFSVRGKVAMLSFDVVLPQVDATDVVGDAAMATFFNLMRTICGPEWAPLEVRFSHGKPQDIEPYRGAFRAPLRFNADQNAILFSTDWLRHPLHGADSDLRRLLQARADELAAAYRDGFAEQVRRVLRTALLTGRASEDEVAAHFSMHSRTLRRHLNECGTSFKQLVEQGRYAIAQQLLEVPAREISEIAAMLEYADSSAFGRAFKRWSGGVPPSAWRARRNATRPGSIDRR
jgi:AraC-like DNA-binding protein